MIKHKHIVLNFHGVENKKWFEDLLLFLKKKYIIITIKELEEELTIDSSLHKQTCHLTFDDGHISFYNVVLPLLKKHQVPASLFISPEIILDEKNYWFQEVLKFRQDKLREVISKTKNIPLLAITNLPARDILKCLTIEDIVYIIKTYKQEVQTGKEESHNINPKELHEVINSGLVTLGAHTISHPILKNETDEKSYYEISESIKLLEKLTGEKVKYFAFPNGKPNIDFGKREIKYLKENGIKLAFSTCYGFAKKDTSLYEIPRIGISDYESRNKIKLKFLLGEKWEMVKKLNKNSDQKLRKKIKKNLLKFKT